MVLIVRFIEQRKVLITQPYAYEFIIPLRAEYRGLRLPVAQEAVEWCRERFGHPDRRPINRRWQRTSEVEIAFMNKEDAFDFKLRWC